MGRKYLIFPILALLLLAVGLYGYRWMENSYKEASGSYTITALRGPAVLGMIKMMEPTIKPSPKLGDTVQYVIEPSLDIIHDKLLTGEVEIAAIPTSMAAKLYNNGANYQLLAINTWGVMYILTNDVTINKWSDLKGKEVLIAEQDATSEVILQYLLSQNGIYPKDVNLKYITSPDELVQLAITGGSEIIVLPEPWVSTVLSKNSNSKIVLNLQEEWTRINGKKTPFVQMCLVVKEKVADRDPKELELFLTDYADSIEWVNKNPLEAGQLFSKHDINIPAKLATRAISRCNLHFINAKEAKPIVESYLRVLLNFSPDSIGGKLPDANFYYKK